jgi:hypothetical protein
MLYLHSKAFLCVGFLFLIAAFKVNNVPGEILLETAINNKTVTFEAFSNGKHSGNSVRINISNNTNSSIRIVVPAGTNYFTQDNGEQKLIQIEDRFIALKPNGDFSGLIAAFCSEASDRCPGKNSSMNIATNSDPKFNKLFAYLKGKKIDKTAYQDAVWAISDNHSVSNMVADSKGSKDFRKYIAEITGQQNSWYTSPQSVRIDDAGNFNIETIKISGKMEFDCAVGIDVHQDIHKANGAVFYKSDKTMKSRAKHIGYTFNLSVRGWEKGNYYINIHDGVNQLAKYEFSI